MSEYEELLDKFDKSDMAGWTRRFFDDLESAFQRDLGVIEENDWHGVLCVGMGGSGAGGTYLSTISSKAAGLPVHYWRDYGLPSWWGPEWLVIATSYSGNTEETLDGVREVISAGGTVVGICSGGELDDVISQSEGSACLNVPPGQMPRSAFGHLFGTQLSACWALGILPKPNNNEVEEMLSRLSKVSLKSDLATNSGMAATLSRSIVGKEIGIVAPTCLGAAAYRFTCQLNENSAKFAIATDIPEMNHNEIVAWTSKSAHERALLFLSNKDLHPRTNSRIEWMLEEIEANTTWVIDCEGESLLERLLYAAHVTDWVSIGLALLTGEDPSDMPAIESLKSHLSSLQ